MVTTYRENLESQNSGKCHKIEEKVGERLSDQCKISGRSNSFLNCLRHVLFRFETTLLHQSRLGSTDKATFRTFWPNTKLGKGWVKYLSHFFWRLLPPNHWYTFDGAPAAGPSRSFESGNKFSSNCLEHKGDMISFWSFGLFGTKSLLLAKPFRCTQIFSYFLLF